MNTISLRDLEAILNESKKPGTKTSIFVPISAALVPPAQLYSGLCAVAEKLYRNAQQQSPDWPSINWELWTKRKARTLCVYVDAEGIRILPLLYELPPRVVVADSFHVKPLLIAETYAAEALLVHFNSSGATLMRVGLYDEQILERYVPSGRTPPVEWPYRLDRPQVRQFMSFVREEVSGFITDRTKLLVVSSSEHSVLQIEGFWAKTKLDVVFAADNFYTEVPRNSLAVAHQRLQREVDRVNTHVARSVDQTHRLEGTEDQIDALRKKIVAKDQKRIVIAVEDVQFGSLDALEGLEFHRAQRDHRDDDILDDLAELALESGVSVQVVPKRFMPAGYKVLAS